MIDVHSHILPKIDDGSGSIEESLSLLSMLWQQGVDTVVATPHFYADEDRLETFLQRRADAFKNLSSAMHGDMPKIKLGAEVSFFDGISYSESIEKLMIQDTPLILVEMPMFRWTEGMIDELLRINGGGKMRVLIAHVERCIFYQKRAVFDRLLQNGVLMQSNAEFFLAKRTKKTALKLLEQERIHMIGSDCHNTAARAPMLRDAMEVIRQESGQWAIDYLGEMESIFFRNFSFY